MASFRAPADPALQPAIENQRRLTVQEWDRMVEAGVFDEDEHLELLEGVIVAMSPQSPPHAQVIRRLCDPLFARVPPEFVASPQLPLALGTHSEPEPDVVIVRRNAAGSMKHHPTTAALIFEVAGESLRKDRIVKAGIYSGAAIPEYVIVNVDAQSLEVHRDPDPGTRRYRSVSTLSVGDRFESVAVPGFSFEVRALFAEGAS
jgi:Uma2 family endonuclease